MNLPSFTARRLVLVALVAVAALGCKKKPKPEPADDTPGSSSIPPVVVAPGRPVVSFDAEGLPVGNDLDSILVRLNHRYKQGNYFLYQLETENLRYLKKQGPVARSAEVFQILRGHAGALTAQPPLASIPFVAWQRAMDWVSRDEVPELGRMLLAERVEARQSDLFTKLAEYKDPRCAEAVAPFLASPARRGSAEYLLKELDSTAERYVLPYLGANNAKETRVAALQVVAAVGTAESAKIVEAMTRDADLQVKHHAKIVFEKLSQRFGTEQDLTAALAALRDGIATMNGSAIHDSSEQLDKAYRPDHPKRAEIFKGLIECCKVPDPKGFGKRAAFLGAMKWSAADDVGTLCELLLFTGGDSVVFLKLKEYKEPKCAETVAAFLTVDLKRAEAAEVLKVIGAPAEQAVAPYSLRAAPNGTEIPFAVRVAAIELLGDIGTKECIPLLRQHAMELKVQGDANKALAKVLARTKGK